MTNLLPTSLRGYDRASLVPDVVAGATLAAIAIPEVLGYTSISQTPLVTGLYTIIFPTIVFALLGSSRMLVVGADSATAALMAAGLLALGTANLTPYSDTWVAYASLVAIVTGALLFLGLGNYLHAKNIHFGLARVDPQLRQSLDAYGFDRHFDEAMVFATLEDAIGAFRGSRAS